MELNFNNGSYFFNIICNELLIDQNLNNYINQDIISFNYTEEVMKLSRGNLSLRNVDKDYSLFIRNGNTFNISFGYKSWNQFAGLRNKSFRSGIKCVCETPSGGGDDNGASTYNINFYADDLNNKKIFRTFESDTRFTVIKQLMTDLGILNQIIDFDTMLLVVNTETSIIQDTGSFSLLNSLAQDWKCFFHVQYKDDNTKIGIFISSWKLSTTGLTFISQVSNLQLYKEVSYNSRQDSNIISYDWQQHIGESGQGDQIDVHYDALGNLIYERRVCEDQKVITYKLNVEMIKNEETIANSKGDLMATVANFMNKSTFEQVKKYFTAEESITAPQGLGFTINLQMYGDPFLVPGLEIKFKSGFPAILTQSQSLDSVARFYIRKADHIITKGGYKTNIEVADSYTFEGGGFLKGTQEVK